jgi:hypothetical protein
MQWFSKEDVQYDAQFGASQPDLETLLRLIDQRTRWKPSTSPASPVLPGSITDASIAVPPGLSASVIGNVNASTIVGTITASQIGSVHAGAIVGTINSTQISSVAATTISGAIVASQIGSVNATSITGVVVSSQLANQIIDDMAKYAAAIQPIPERTTFPTGLPNDDSPPDSYFYYIPTGHFYQMNHAGTAYSIEDSVSGSQRFYHIGAISANQIVGLIVAAQINSITAGQITGAITAGQIASVNASTIVGSITATQIASVNASAITGSITSSQIASVNASTITGTIISTQIGSINAATITIGLIVDGQIANISGTKLTVGTVDSDKLNATLITVGGAGGHPGRIDVVNASSSLVAQIGTLSTGQYGGWFQVLGAGGSNYSTAKIYTDATSLHLRDADFLVNASGFQIQMSPTTFDSTYSSLAVQVSGSSDLTSMISRGILVYHSGTLLGGIVRDPANAANLQGVFYDSGHTLAILIDGYSGAIRAAKFQCGGSPGFTGSIPSGHTINVAGGIITGYV